MIVKKPVLPNYGLSGGHYKACNWAVHHILTQNTNSEFSQVVKPIMYNHIF